MNPSEIPSRNPSAFDEALRALGKAREALDMATLQVARAFQLAQLGPSPQPWPERLKHGFVADFVAEDKLLYAETAKRAASKIEEAYAAAARELYGKTGTFAVPPDASKCRHTQLANGAMPAPFCEVCGSFDLRCALNPVSAPVDIDEPTPAPRRSTADHDLRGESRPAPTPEDIRRCNETTKPVRIRPSEDDCA